MKPTRLNRFAVLTSSAPSLTSAGQSSQGRLRRLACIPSLVLFLVGAQSAQAVDFNWDPGLTGGTGGSGSGTWNSANTNWFDVIASANVSWADANRPVFGGAVGPFVVTVANDFATTGLFFNKTSYTLSAASAQTITTTGSAVTATGVTATIGSNITVTRAANDLITTPSGAGGTLNIGSADQLSTNTRYVNSQSGSTGARTLIIEKGTTVNVNSGGYLGDSSVTNYTAPNVNGTTIGVGNAAVGGTLVVKPGGTVTAGNNTQVIVGLAAAASGTLTIDGGDVNGGAITTLSGGGPVLPAAYGGLRFGGSTGNTSGTRIANLNGGTLTVGQVFIGALAVGSTATNTLNFNGGTLKAIISNTTFMTGLTAANVQVGGAKINTNGFDITVGQALIHDPALVATPDGGLIKSGSGTLTLTAANTYDGGTTISEGKLLLSGSGSLAAAGAVTLATGATLEKANGSAQVLSGPVTGGGTLRLASAGSISLQNSGNSFGSLEINNASARIFINSNALALPALATVNVSAGALVFGVASSYGNSIAVSSGAGIAARAATTLNNVALPTSGFVIFNNDDATTGSLTISSNLSLTGGLTMQIGGTRMLVTGGAIGGVNLSGNLTGSGSLVMTSSGNVANPNFGTGVLTLSGMNTYSGDTTVNSGTLRLSNAPNPLNANSGNDASTVTIAASGATLDLTYTGTDKVAKLIVGATQLADGVYGKTGSVSPIIGISQITGDGTLTVSSAPAAGYSSWASINGAGANLNDDHDNDGVSNGVEYLVGGPTLPTANTTGFTPLPGVTTAAGVSSVTWTKAATYTGTYPSGFVVETSAALAAGSWTAETLGVNVVITGNNVKYTFPAGTKNFARLKVTGP